MMESDEKKGLLKFTRGYSENVYADVFAFFRSDMFGADSDQESLCSRSGFHGEQLSTWLNEKLSTIGYKTTNGFCLGYGWIFTCSHNNHDWSISSESIEPHKFVQWKITINSGDKNMHGCGGACPSECAELLYHIRDVLSDEKHISNVEWNRALLNR